MTASIEQVEPGVQRLLLSNWRGRTVGYDASAYLIDGVLVDSGFPAVHAEFLAAVRALRPRGAIVTHWHEDHAGNAPALAGQGVPLSMHPGCERLLRERPSIRAYRRVVWGQTPRLVRAIEPFDASPLHVIDAPGHSTDHRVAWDAERRIVASGDLYLGVKVRVAHAHESPNALLGSLRMVAALEPKIMLCAHRGVVQDATGALRAKIGWLEATVGEILALAARGAREAEIQHRVLGHEAFVGRVSFGEYSKGAFVRVVLAEGAVRSLRSG